MSDAGRRLLRLLASDQAQRVLSRLGEEPDGLTAAQLAARTQMAQADLSRVLNRLADRGLIYGERRRTPGKSGRPPMVWHQAPSPAWEILRLAEETGL